MSMETRVIYFAGGCFWGVEKLMQAIPGVVDAVSGYANGTCEADATYETVCSGKTGFRETVRVDYDPAKVSLDQLLFAYFAVVDPSVRNRQGHDVGTQYQAGIYYTDDAARQIVERVAAVERHRSEQFFIEIEPLKNFFPAEEYHQDYLNKNPGGYCHIPFAEIERIKKAIVDAGKYARPADDEIEKKLTPEQLAVTQRAATERPFQNEFFGHHEKGLYVDVVTGEPLFTSNDKYASACGWPAFSKPVEESVVIERDDRSHGMIRTEVRSRAGDSHLGHVFEGDPESPSGVRYCINSAALRFIPYETLEEEGYGYIKNKFEE